MTLELGTVADESIEFTLTPVNAVKAAWVYMEDTGREVTAEQVLGCTSADAEGVQKLVAEPLSPATAYVIYAAVEGKDGKAVLSEPLKATTTGTQIEIEEFAAVSASAECWGGTSACNWTLELTDDAGNKASFDLYVDTSTSRDYIPESEFEVADGVAPGIISKGEYSYVKIGEEKLNIEEGSLVVEPLLEESGDEGVDYAIMGQLVAGGRTFEVYYEGLVTGTRNPNSAVEVVLTAAKLLEINDPQPGEFYVKLNDTNWNYEVALDFQGPADAPYLYPNTYSLADGSLLSSTSISGYYGAPTTDALASCVAEVSMEGKIYTIDVTAEGTNGVKFHMVYEGEIENMPELVVVEPVYATFDWYPGLGQLVLCDSPDMYASTFYAVLMVSSPESVEYLHTAFIPGANANDEIPECFDLESSGCYLNVVSGEPEMVAFAPGSFLDVMTLMPDQDMNLLSFQLKSTDGKKIYAGTYQGPLYGGGAVSTDPVDFPVYGVTDAEVTGKTDSAVEISFATLSGPMQICFNTSSFGPGAYEFSETGGNNTFTGAFMVLGIDWDEPDVMYTFESGRIGVIAQGDGSYTFQFDNVIARAEDGSAKNLGPVTGDAYQTTFTVKITGL